MADSILTKPVTWGDLSRLAGELTNNEFAANRQHVGSLLGDFVDRFLGDKAIRAGSTEKEEARDADWRRYCTCLNGSVFLSCPIHGSAPETQTGSDELVGRLWTFARCHPACNYIDAERLINETITEITRLRTLEQPVSIWECNDCGFGFRAEHIDQDGGYSCPVCAESKYLQDIERLSREVAEADAKRDGAVKIANERLDQAQGKGYEAIAATASVLHEMYELVSEALSALTSPASGEKQG